MNTMTTTIELGAAMPDILAGCTYRVWKSIFENDIPSSHDHVCHPDIRGMNEGIGEVKTEESEDVRPLSAAEKAKVAEACLKYGSLVKEIAKKYVRPGFCLEDLSQVGYIALFKSVRDWREDGGASFATIANGDIRNALEAVTKRVRVKVPIEDERPGPVRYTRKVEVHDVLFDTDSMDAPYEDGDSLHDLLPDSANAESLMELSLALDKLDDDDSDLVDLYAQGYSLNEVALMTGRSKWVIRHLHDASLERLRAAYGVSREPTILGQAA